MKRTRKIMITDVFNFTDNNSTKVNEAMGADFEIAGKIVKYELAKDSSVSTSSRLESIIFDDGGYGADFPTRTLALFLFGCALGEKCSFMFIKDEIKKMIKRSNLDENKQY